MSDPSTASQSRAWVEVRLDSLRANARAVQRAVGPDCALLPMLKADAYGLGMGPVADALARPADGPAPFGFGVAAVAEGERLRAHGWRGRILVTAPLLPAEHARAAAAALTPCLSDLESVARWARQAAPGPERLAFHAEIDTGMGRAGFAWRDAAGWGAEVERLARAGARWEGCFTHFHSADEPDLAPTMEQWRRFREALDRLPPDPARVVHCANSAAALRLSDVRVPEVRVDVARPGIFLYGGAAGPGTRPRPVAAVRARLALVREVEAGATVGYGATYRATRRERWGTLAIGYGDGLPRALGAAGGEALVRGRRVPLIGRVSMDLTVVDLTAVPDAAPGDVATLIGADGAEEITVDEVAGRCGTISYEVLTGLTTRLPRVYLEAGGPAG